MSAEQVCGAVEMGTALDEHLALKVLLKLPVFLLQRSRLNPKPEPRPFFNLHLFPSFDWIGLCVSQC